MNDIRSKRNHGYTFTEAELLAISQDIFRQHRPATQSTSGDLVVVPVDPYHLHASWNLSFCVLDKQQLDRRPQLSGFTLRVFHRMAGWFDVKVEGLKNDRRIGLPLDNSPYSAELGIFDLDGRFVRLLRSESIRVPRATPTIMTPSQPQQFFSIENDNSGELSETLQVIAANDTCYHDLTAGSIPREIQRRQEGNSIRNFCFEPNGNLSEELKSPPLTYSGIGWARARA